MTTPKDVGTPAFSPMTTDDQFLEIMRTKFLPLIALIGTLLLQTGCTEAPEDVANGDDPMKALTVGTTSTRYDGPYWLYQRKAAPKLYRRGVAYCEKQSLAEKPNCRVVMAAHRFTRSLEQKQPKGRGYTGILELDNPAAAPQDSL